MFICNIIFGVAVVVVADSSQLGFLLLFIPTWLIHICMCFQLARNENVLSLVRKYIGNINVHGNN